MGGAAGDPRGRKAGRPRAATRGRGRGRPLAETEARALRGKGRGSPRKRRPTHQGATPSPGVGIGWVPCSRLPWSPEPRVSPAGRARDRVSPRRPPAAPPRQAATGRERGAEGGGGAARGWRGGVRDARGGSPGLRWLANWRPAGAGPAGHAARGRTGRVAQLGAVGSRRGAGTGGAVVSLYLLFTF